MQSAQTLMRFTIERCDVAIGGSIAGIIDNNCYSTALGVSMMQTEWRVTKFSRFAYKSFVSSNVGNLQGIPSLLKCVLKVCTLDACDLENCNTNNGYAYTERGADYVLVSEIEDGVKRSRRHLTNWN